MAACSTFTPALCLIESLHIKSTTQDASSKKLVSLSRRPHSHCVRAVHMQRVRPLQETEKKEDQDDARLKVFADETTGVVCYRTDSGEIVCEGVDEGPHFYPPSGSNFYMPDTRAAAILPLLGEVMYEI